MLGDLYVKAADVTITENSTITDGPSTSWNSAGDTGWVTTGTVNLIVANPTGKSITLDNLTNQLGALGINTTGTAGTLTSVLITDNTDLTQAAVWNVGAAPVTLDARTHAVALSGYSNVLATSPSTPPMGSPTSIAITEDDAITQGSVWALTGTPVTLVAQNDKSITLTNARQHPRQPDDHWWRGQHHRERQHHAGGAWNHHRHHHAELHLPAPSRWPMPAMCWATWRSPVRPAP